MLKSIVLATVLVGGVVRAQGPAQPVDPARLGPKIGEIVPAFALADRTGQTRTLESIMGPKGAMIVFFRSASW